MPLLSDLVVRFTAQGVGEVASAMASLGSGFVIVAGAAQAAVGTFLSLAQAGINASAEGQRLQTITERLSRQLGSLFIPVLEGIGDLVQKLSGWFEGLSQSQFDAISGAKIFNAVFDTLGKAIDVGLRIFEQWIPVIDIFVSGIAQMIEATQPLRDAMGRVAEQFSNIVARFSANFWGAIIPVVVQLANVIAATLVPALELVASIMGGINDLLESIGLKAKTLGGGGGHRSLSAPGGGKGSLTAPYERIQAAALKEGQPKERNYQAEIAKHTAETAANVQQTTMAVQNLKPAVGA